MAIYEFDCHQCGHTFDKLVRSSTQVSELTCPSCGSPQIKKRLSVFASRSAGGSATVSSAAACAPGGL